MKPFINNYEDILELLDEKVDNVNWDNFYIERKRPVPFITQNTMPDENLVAFLNSQTEIKSAVEFMIRECFIICHHTGESHISNSSKKS